MSIYLKITLLMMISGFVSEFFAKAQRKMDTEEGKGASNAYMFWGTIDLLSWATAVVFAVISIVKA